MSWVIARLAPQWPEAYQTHAGILTIRRVDRVGQREASRPHVVRVWAGRFLNGAECELGAQELEPRSQPQATERTEDPGTVRRLPGPLIGIDALPARLEPAVTTLPLAVR